MGKREIVLIAAFLLMGLLVYQVTAPDTSSDRGFSVSGIIEDIKSEIERPRHSAEATISKKTPVGPEVIELAVPDFRGKLTIVGEARDDLEAELRVAVWTEDRDEAARRVKDVEPAFETTGGTIQVRVAVSNGVPRLRSELTLRVPQRLRVRAEVSSGAIDIRGVATVTLDARGEVVISDVRDSVSGEILDGDVRISKAGSVRVELGRCAAAITDVRGSVVVEATDGDLVIREPRGGVQVEAIRVDTTVSGARGPLHINAADGRTVVDAPTGPVDIEGVRTEVTIRLTTAVPVQIATTDEGIAFTPPANAGITLTAVASDGSIESHVAGLAVDEQDRVQRVTADLGGGGPTVSLRTSRGDIEILPAGASSQVER